MPHIYDEYYYRTRSGDFAHYCPEWDCWLIDEYDVEFTGCTCFTDNREARYIKDKLTKVIEKNRQPVEDSPK
jgi:hypothetical protein